MKEYSLDGKKFRIFYAAYLVVSEDGTTVYQKGKNNVLWHPRGNVHADNGSVLLPSPYREDGRWDRVFRVFSDAGTDRCPDSGGILPDVLSGEKKAEPELNTTKIALLDAGRFFDEKQK